MQRNIGSRHLGIPSGKLPRHSAINRNADTSSQLYNRDIQPPATVFPNGPSKEFSAPQRASFSTGSPTESTPQPSIKISVALFSHACATDSPWRGAKILNVCSTGVYLITNGHLHPTPSQRRFAPKDFFQIPIDCAAPPDSRPAGAQPFPIDRTVKLCNRCSVVTYETYQTNAHRDFRRPHTVG